MTKSNFSENTICATLDGTEIFNSGRISAIFAGGIGAGKATFCFSLALSIAAGKPFMKTYIPTKAFPTAYISCMKSEHTFCGRYLPSAKAMLGMKTIESANDKFALSFIDYIPDSAYSDTIYTNLIENFGKFMLSKEPKVVFIEDCSLGLLFLRDFRKGRNSKKNPLYKLQDLAEKYNICFVLVTTIGTKITNRYTNNDDNYISMCDKYAAFADSVSLLYDVEDTYITDYSSLKVLKNNNILSGLALAKEREYHGWKTI